MVFFFQPVSFGAGIWDLTALPGRFGMNLVDARGLNGVEMYRG